MPTSFSYLIAFLSLKALKIAIYAALRWSRIFSFLSFRFHLSIKFHVIRWTARMLIWCVLNQFEGVVTPYTFIASDARPLGPGARVTLRRNISSSWDHRRNYPLMPIHKSVGHFQSPARNSRRNTAAIHSHTDATCRQTHRHSATRI